MSSPERANRPDSASWPAASTCTAQWLLALNTGRLSAFLARLHNTIGGSSDTELKLFAVKPTGVPSAARVVITVTPVAKLPSAARKASRSSAGAAFIGGSAQGWRTK